MKGKKKYSIKEYEYICYKYIYFLNEHRNNPTRALYEFS
jgi:hypothetical protein